MALYHTLEAENVRPRSRPLRHLPSRKRSPDPAGLPPSGGPGVILVHGRLHGHDGRGFGRPGWPEHGRRRRWSVAQRGMRSDRVVLSSPALDDDARLGEAVEHLPVQQLVSELGVEALAVAILPRTAGLDEGGLRPDGRDPLSNGPGDELRTIIGTDMARHAAQDEEVRQDVDDVRRLQLPVYADLKALPSELVDDVQHAELPAVVGAVLDEVIGPDMVGPLGSEPHAGAAVQPQTPLLRLLRR